MDEQTKRIWTDRFAAYAPRMETMCDAIAHRHELQPCERDDLYQACWLALLAHQCGREGDAQASEAVGDDIAKALTLAGREAERMTVRWRDDGASEDAREDGTSTAAVRVARRAVVGCAADRADTIRSLVDLRLDIAEVIGRLPVADRLCCDGLMRGETIDATLPFGPSPTSLPSVVATLRIVFEAHGLRTYL